MAPKQPSMDLLFHPKKNKKPQQPPPPRKTPPTPRPKPAPEQKEEDGLQLPDWPFQDFRLLSSALNGWKYDVMKFDSRKVQDVSRWTAPVKLNRKDLRRDDQAAQGTPQAIGPMLGPDGKPVIGADGKVVMVDAEGKPIHAADAASGSGSGKDKGKAAAANATLEDIGRTETHAFFMPAANDVFKFVPAHRWYKFQKKLKHNLPTDTAGVDQLYATSQKRDPQAWLASRNGGRGVSAATAAMFKAEAEGRTITIGDSLVHDSGQSLGPGGRRLKAVDSGMDHLFGDDDEDGDTRSRRTRELGGEGDMDEQVYEEDFADDDEHAAPDENDEEAKEAEASLERLKREYRTANKHREAGVDEDEEEDEKPGMSKQAKAMQKLIRNREGNDAYESDEDNKNPYASSEEEEEEELPTYTGPAIQQQPQQVDVQAKSQTPNSGDAAQPQPDVNGSRATSPLASPSLGGHSVVAKRATSPKAFKPITQDVSKNNSPANSRATSPAAGSRATSPVANGQKVGSNKRKAEDLTNAASPGANGQPKAKKRREVAPVTSEEMQTLLIEWLKTSPKEKATTRECIQHFTPYLTDQAKKAEFSKMVREVAMLKDGILVLRASAASAAPSPAPMVQ
ncbi:Transcription initiation factor IIF subunit alpha [Leucoagaricus sp. SymC.cos]|nr:Transcription initiation factor IIF subunit alpha [Leucoagaricus sp. SymC.cos]